MSSSYKRLSKLGSGAFATTFLVEEQGKGPESKGGGKRLVMKRVPCRHMRAANAALQEVKVLLSCHHDGIVGYHDFSWIAIATKILSFALSWSSVTRVTYGSGSLLQGVRTHHCRLPSWQGGRCS
jgi:serine/threonine protein kinase